MTGKAVFKQPATRAGSIAWLLVMVGVVGTVLSSGCGTSTITPVSPGEGSTLSLKVEPAATAVAPGKEIAITVTATSKAGAPVDGTRVSLESDALGTVTPTSGITQNGKLQATFKAGTSVGTATVKATAGDASHAVSIAIDPNPNAIATGDEIPISQVIFREASPANFKVKATLTNMRVNFPELCWDWTHGKWPAIPSSYTVIGNHWVFANIDGQWYGATWEWLRSNTTCASLQATSSDPPFIQSKVYPLNSWRPKVGEEVGFMVSTICRGGIQPGNSPRERSRIVKVRWQ